MLLPGRPRERLANSSSILRWVLLFYLMKFSNIYGTSFVYPSPFTLKDPKCIDNKTKRSEEIVHRLT